MNWNCGNPTEIFCKKKPVSARAPVLWRRTPFVPWRERKTRTVINKYQGEKTPAHTSWKPQHEQERSKWENEGGNKERCAEASADAVALYKKKRRKRVNNPQDNYTFECVRNILENLNFCNSNFSNGKKREQWRKMLYKLLGIFMIELLGTWVKRKKNQIRELPENDASQWIEIRRMIICDSGRD